MEVVGSGATNSTGAIVQTPDGGVEVDFVAKGIGEGRSFCDRRGDRRLEKVHCRCRVLPACRRGLVRRLVGGHACDKSRLRCGAHQRFCWPGTGVVGLYRKSKAVIEDLADQADQAKPDLAGGEGAFLFCRAQARPYRLSLRFISPTPVAHPVVRLSVSICLPSQRCSPQSSRHFHFLGDLSGTQLSMTRKGDFPGSRQRDC